MAKKRRRFPSKTLLLLVLLLLVAAALVWLFRPHHKVPITQVTDKGGANSSGSPLPSQSGSSGSPKTPSSIPRSNQPLELSNRTTFVSNHYPNLDGQPAPNQEQSICVTTPGAICSISFTKDGITKSLPAKTADSEGNASWDWTLQSVGLTEGVWKVTATASLNGQTKTAQDALDLHVGA